VTHNEVGVETESGVQDNLNRQYFKDRKELHRLIRPTLPLDAPMTVGSHLLSLESISKNTASCSSKSFSSFATSAFA